MDKKNSQKSFIIKEEVVFGII